VKIFLKALMLVGIILSAVAAFYSIGGLVLIFKGSPNSIIVLAVALELAKVMISVYLHIFWGKAKKLLLAYLTFALIILACITSLGIFGALSSAYFNSTDTTEYSTKLNTLKSKIDIENGRITNINTQIAAISAVPKEDKQDWHYWKMNTLSKDVGKISDTIDKLNDEMLPYRVKMNQINSEVGPLKYLAEWIYGETENSIDKAVQLFIVMLVLVFDPLALLLIFASIHGSHIINEEKKVSYLLNKNEEEIEKLKDKEHLKEVKQEIKHHSESSIEPIEKPVQETKEESVIIQQPKEEIMIKPSEYKAEIKSTKKLELEPEDKLTQEDVEEYLSDFDKQLKKISYLK